VFLFRFRRSASALQRGDVIVDRDREHLVVLDCEYRGDIVRTRLQGHGEIVFDWPRDFLLSVYRDRNGRPGAIDEDTRRLRSYVLYDWTPEGQEADLSPRSGCERSSPRSRQRASPRRSG
jgi:hypothetical protein